MSEDMINKIVPVQLFGLEKKSFRSNRMFIGDLDDGLKYSINVLYENTFDPSDSTHKFALMPDNPNFLKIKNALEEGQEIEGFDLKELSPSLHDMYGAWVIVDLSKTPVCRVYSENVCRMVNGKPEIVHKAGEPIHKTNPRTKEDLPELAIMTHVPVWGFCRKAPNGNWVWMKGNDPLERIQREINQGRMIYVDVEKDYTIKDGPEAEEQPEEKKEEEPATRTIAPESAADITAIG